MPSSKMLHLVKIGIFFNSEGLLEITENCSLKRSNNLQRLTNYVVNSISNSLIVCTPNQR